jgi:acetolactate synthase I/II/III large subunit
MKLSTYLNNYLVQKGIDTVFLLQGGMIIRLIDEIHRIGEITIVSMHHEQAASFAADAYSRTKNIPGVAFATSGPGATNLITGIGSCFFDSVPAIFITGQVNQNEQKSDLETRQIGFQETDIVSIVEPITKAAFAINDVEEVPSIFERAFKIASEGRPGPVLIDIPMNLQNMEISELDSPHLEETIKPDSNEIAVFSKELISQLRSAKKPLVLAGRGIRVAQVQSAFLRFIEKYDIPVTTSLLGLDAIPYDHPNRVGFIGTYGNRWANQALNDCDVLLVLGSRLDLRQTGADAKSFENNKKIFHVDIDRAELNNRIKGCETLQCDLKTFFDNNSYNNSDDNNSSWKEEILANYLNKPDVDELKGIVGINPNHFMHQLSKSSGLAKIITTDVGNNQMWAAQSIELKHDQLFLSSGGMGAMGYSLPAAIGACFANGLSPVLSISGDGGFQINIQELQTIKRNKLPIKIVILNNRSLGMIRQFQDSYFNSCYESTVWGYDSPDFIKLAGAYGINGQSISSANEIDSGLEQLWRDRDEPFVLNVNVDYKTNAYPKMLYGKPLSIMEPEHD